MNAFRIKAERDQMARALRNIVVEAELTLSRFNRAVDQGARDYINGVRSEALEGLRAVADPEVSHD